MARVDVGDLHRFTITFLDGAGVAADPTAVRVFWKSPDGVVSTPLVFGSDPEVVKDGVGLYHVDVILDQPGWWHPRWEGTGAVHAASEGGATYVLKQRVVSA